MTEEITMLLKLGVIGGTLIIGFWKIIALIKARLAVIEQTHKSTANSSKRLADQITRIFEKIGQIEIDLVQLRGDVKSEYAALRGELRGRGAINGQPRPPANAKT